MCRDFSAIDEFAFAVSAPRLRNSGDTSGKYGIVRRTLGPYMDKITNKPRADQLQALREEVATLHASTALTPLEQTEQNAIQEARGTLLSSLKLPGEQIKLLLDLEKMIVGFQSAKQPSVEQQDELLVLQKDMSDLQVTLGMNEEQRSTFAALQARKLKLTMSIDTRADQVTAALPAKEATIKTMEDEDEKNTKEFIMALWTLAHANSVITPTDHVGRARLFGAWLASSIRYVYDQNTISTPGVTTADFFRRLQGYCSDYALVFINMFNTVTRTAWMQIQTDKNFLAQQCMGYTKSSSRAESGDKDRGHSWAVCPISTDSSGVATVWKVIDPCWMQGGHDPNEISKYGIASQWFYNSNQTILRTHLAGNLYHRLPLQKVEMTLQTFDATDLAPFDQDNLNLQIEESSLQPQNYTLAGQTEQLFQFARLCSGARKFPAPVYVVPYINQEYIIGQAVQFNDANVAKMNTRDVAQKSKSGAIELHLAMPFADQAFTQPITQGLGFLTKMGIKSVYWKVIARYSLAK